MATIYYYIDETYREVAGHWHCNVGGALVEASRIVEVELSLEERVYTLCTTRGFPFGQGEFKYSDFFRQTSEDFQCTMAAELAEALRKHATRFVVSHAKIKTNRLPDLRPLQNPSQQIQHLAYINVDNHLAPLCATHVIQRVVDLGISESFRPIYEMYVAATRGLAQMKARGIPDSLITIKNYQNSPIPLFLRSQESRLLQFSDLVIGVLLARETEQMTPFKNSILQALAPILENVSVFSVEWNADDVSGSDA